MLHVCSTAKKYMDFLGKSGKKEGQKASMLHFQTHMILTPALKKSVKHYEIHQSLTQGFSEENPKCLRAGFHLSLRM